MSDELHEKLEQARKELNKAYYWMGFVDGALTLFVVVSVVTIIGGIFK